MKKNSSNTNSTENSSLDFCGTGRAIFDFLAEKDNDLNLKKGEIIQILKKTKNGWWIGICKNKIGYFPSNYIEVISE